MKIVIDTSVFVDYIRSGKGYYLSLIDLAKGGSTVLYTPTVVVLETYAGESMNDQHVVQGVKRAIGPIKIINLTRQIAEVSGELLRKKTVLDMPDAIVAATALELDAYLATSNQKHFAKVKDLRLYK